MLLGMGGTISSILSDSGIKPGRSSEELVSLIPEVLEKYNITTREVMSIDSANLQPQDWVNLAAIIYEEIKKEDVTGVVIIHGTDQLVYSSSMAAFLIQSNKPIVFTGAQIPLSIVGSDGRKNLIDAIRVAAEANIAESVIVFNSKILRAVRSIKLREYDLDAFESVDPTYIADIAYDLHFYDNTIRPRSSLTPKFQEEIQEHVALIKVFPGIDPQILLQIATLGYQGVILEAFGAGNVPTLEKSLIPAIKDLSAQNIPVIITSQCIFGTTELIYQTGKLAHEAGAISGYDLTSEAALVKLMAVLPHCSTLEDVRIRMHKNVVGELNPRINKIQN